MKTVWGRTIIFILCLGLVFASFGFTEPASASTGLSVSDLSGQTAEDLVEKIIGTGVTVSNVQFKGTSVSAGSFSGGSGIVGFEEGIILSSGTAQDVIGPNDIEGTSTSLGLSGDGDLNSLIPGYYTHDATVLEFDFVPEKDIISFEYVFSSEEYNEYVNSSYNDVFGFFLNGQNIAVIPGTSTPVAINNVNLYQNSSLYINNSTTISAPLDTEMDGLTVVLPVEAHVNQGQVNHIKLAVADSGDSVLDSNVFIKAGSFTDKPANKLPVISADQPAVTVNVGQAAANTGTVSDPDGDPISLSASVGTVVYNGDGTWSWSYVPSAPLNNQPVTITVSDDRGGTASATFYLTANAIAGFTWLPPLSSSTPADINAADPLDIGFTTFSALDKSVAIRIRNAQTGVLIAGYTYGAQITYDSATGEYHQEFIPAKYNVQPGTQLKIMVYFGGKLKGTAYANVL